MSPEANPRISARRGRYRPAQAALLLVLAPPDREPFPTPPARQMSIRQESTAPPVGRQAAAQDSTLRTHRRWSNMAAYHSSRVPVFHKTADQEPCDEPVRETGAPCLP